MRLRKNLVNLDFEIMFLSWYISKDDIGCNLILEFLNFIVLCFIMFMNLCCGCGNCVVISVVVIFLRVILNCIFYLILKYLGGNLLFFNFRRVL